MPNEPRNFGLQISEQKQDYTWCFRVARLFVCIGDWGMTPFEGGMPIRPHNMVCPRKTKDWKKKSLITCVNMKISALSNELALPRNPEEEGHNDMKMVSLNWIPSVGKVEMQHCDRNSKAPQS